MTHRDRSITHPAKPPQITSTSRSSRVPYIERGNAVLNRVGTFFFCTKPAIRHDDRPSQNKKRRRHVDLICSPFPCLCVALKYVGRRPTAHVKMGKILRNTYTHHPVVYRARRGLPLMYRTGKLSFPKLPKDPTCCTDRRVGFKGDEAPLLFFSLRGFPISQPSLHCLATL